MTSEASVQTLMFGVGGVRYWSVPACHVAGPDSDCSPELLFPNTRYGMNQQHVVVVSQFWPKYLERRTSADGTVGYYGMYLDIADALAQFMNFTYDLVVAPDGHWGSHLPNGSWTGIVGQLQQRVGDFSAAPLTVLPTRRTVMDFAAMPLQEFPYTGVYRRSAASNSALTLYVLPFQRSVWLLLIGTIVVTAAVHAVIQRWAPVATQRRPPRGNLALRSVQRFLASFEFLFSTFFHESFAAKHTIRSASLRVLVGAFWLFSFYILTLWSANIMSYLSVIIQDDPIETFNDLITQNRYSYGLLAGTAAQEKLQESPNPDHRQLWANIKRQSTHDPDVLSPYYDVHAKKVINEDYVYIETSETLTDLKNKHCDLVLMTEGIIPARTTLGAQKNSYYTPKLTEFTMRMMENGLLEWLFNRYFAGQSACSDAAQKRVDSSYRPIYLWQVLPIFTICVVMVVVSFAVLLLELFLHKTDGLAWRWVFGSLAQLRR